MFDRTEHHWNALFSLESRNEVLEAVLMETHLCSCLPGRAVLFRKALRGQRLFLLELYITEWPKLSYFLFLIMKFTNRYTSFWLVSLADVWLNQEYMLYHTQCCFTFLCYSEFIMSIQNFQKWVLMWVLGYFLRYLISFGVLKRYWLLEGNAMEEHSKLFEDGLIQKVKFC